MYDQHRQQAIQKYDFGSNETKLIQHTKVLEKLY